MEELKQLQSEVEKIKQRNAKVEKDKAWETSWIRKGFVAITTYVFITLVMFSLKIENPLISAIIPTLGYLLSTLSYGLVRDWWLRHKSK